MWIKMGGGGGGGGGKVKIGLLYCTIVKQLLSLVDGT